MVEVYCSGAKSKVVLRSELSNAAEWTRYGSHTRYSQLLLCVHVAITDNSCPAKNGRLNEKEKKSLLGLQTLLVGSREHNFMFRYEGRLD